MKVFKFRLEKVLQFREGVRKEKERAIALANAQLREAEEQLEVLIEALRKNTLAEGILSIEQVYLQGYLVEGIKERIELQKRLIEELQQAVEVAREEYRIAASEAEALVKLRAQRLQQYTLHIDKEQEKFLDELTIQRVTRRDE